MMKESIFLILIVFISILNNIVLWDYYDTGWKKVVTIILVCFIIGAATYAGIDYYKNQQYHIKQTMEDVLKNDAIIVNDTTINQTIQFSK